MVKYKSKVARCEYADRMGRMFTREALEWIAKKVKEKKIWASSEQLKVRAETCGIVKAATITEDGYLEIQVTSETIPGVLALKVVNKPGPWELKNGAIVFDAKTLLKAELFWTERSTVDGATVEAFE